MKKKRETASTASVELRLDAIWNSPDPEVKHCLTQYMREEYRRADERVLQRLAERFVHLLPAGNSFGRQGAVA